MSRMTKFLKQTCSFERVRRNDEGTAVLDKYGEPQYDSPIKIKCRRERLVKDVQTSTGAVLRSTTRYFVDESQPIEVDDRFDGKTILSVEEYINQLGTTEGYECYV